MKLSSPILAAAVYLASMPASPGQPSITIPPDQPVANSSQAAWSKAWWQWAGSFDYAHSPVADRTGSNCHLKQKGPVWFLAGTYETVRTIRTCTVPRDKYIFFPLINYVVMPGSTKSSCPSCCASFAEKAKTITDDPSLLVMLPPLSPGKHVLNFGGGLPELSQAVTYTLIVE
jgi:hypothetical protein